MRSSEEEEEVLGGGLPVTFPPCRAGPAPPGSSGGWPVPPGTRSPGPRRKAEVAEAQRANLYSISERKVPQRESKEMQIKEVPAEWPGQIKATGEIGGARSAGAEQKLKVSEWKCDT